MSGYLLDAGNSIVNNAYPVHRRLAVTGAGEQTLKQIPYLNEHLRAAPREGLKGKRKGEGRFAGKGPSELSATGCVGVSCRQSAGNRAGVEDRGLVGSSVGREESECPEQLGSRPKGMRSY